MAERCLGMLDARLSKSKFFLGDEPTVVDFVGVFTFTWADAHEVPLDSFANLARWWKELKEVPVVRALIEDGVPVIPTPQMVGMPEGVKWADTHST